MKEKWMAIKNGHEYFSLEGHRADIVPVLALEDSTKVICYIAEVDNEEVGTAATKKAAREIAEDKIFCLLATEGKLPGKAFKDFHGCVGNVGSIIKAKGVNGTVVGICPWGRAGSRVFYERKNGEVDFESACFVEIECGRA